MGNLISIKKSDMRFFDAAKKAAETSEFPRFHVGCCVVYQGNIIATGVNTEKTDTFQKKYNRYRHFNNSQSHKPVRHSAHAEIKALKSISYPIAQQIDWKKVKVYTYRICKGHDSKRGLARPCAGCMAFIKSLGIRNIYYSTDDGYAAERLEY